MNTHPDLIMLDCHYCSFQQHASCYRILSVEDVPNQHCCVTCSKEYGVKCTDSKLVKMSSNPGIAGTCLFRRMENVNTELEERKKSSVVKDAFQMCQSGE